MIKAVERAQHEDKRWLEGYIPNPSTWLNQRRWEDEPFTGVSKEKKPEDRPEWAKRIKRV